VLAPETTALSPETSLIQAKHTGSCAYVYHVRGLIANDAMLKGLGTDVKACRKELGVMALQAARLRRNCDAMPFV
jgi:hypothetical protein